MKKILIFVLLITSMFSNAQTLKQDKLQLKYDSLVFDSLKKDFYIKAGERLKEKKIDSLSFEIYNDLYYTLKDSNFSGYNKIKPIGSEVFGDARECWDALTVYLLDGEIQEWVIQYYDNKITYSQLYDLIQDKLEVGKLLITSYGYKIK